MRLPKFLRADGYPRYFVWVGCRRAKAAYLQRRRRRFKAQAAADAQAQPRRELEARGRDWKEFFAQALREPVDAHYLDAVVMPPGIQVFPPGWKPAYLPPPQFSPLRWKSGRKGLFIPGADIESLEFSYGPLSLRGKSAWLPDRQVRLCVNAKLYTIRGWPNGVTGKTGRLRFGCDNQNFDGVMKLADTRFEFPTAWGPVYRVTLIFEGHLETTVEL